MTILQLRYWTETTSMMQVNMDSRMQRRASSLLHFLLYYTYTS